MRVTKVTASAHSLRVAIDGLEEKRSRSFVFVQVETDEGLVGFGLTGKVGSGPQHLSVAHCINLEVAPAVLGANPLETDRIWHRLHMGLNPRSLSGVWSSAVSAVDIALWDLKGKALGQPVWRLLGGARNPVRAYITYGYPEYTEAQLVTYAEQLVAEGHDSLKIVVGANGDASMETDIARVRAVRRALGPAVRLMVDANQLFSLAAAVRFAVSVEDCDLSWFEEPVLANDPLLLAELRKRTRIPIAAGQSEGHRFRHREMLLAGGLDVLQPNVCYVGGYTEAVRVAGLAASFNLPIANGGGWPHHNMHLQAGVSCGTIVEFHVEMWRTGELIYLNAPNPKRGFVQVPDVPGLGLEPNMATLESSRDA